MDSLARRLLLALADATPAFSPGGVPALNGPARRLLIALADAAPAFTRAPIAAPTVLARRRASARRRVRISTGIEVAAIIVVVLALSQAGTSGPLRPWWITLGAVMSVAAAALPAYELLRNERLRSMAEQNAIEAAVQMRVTVNDALAPIARQLGRIATASSPQERASLGDAVIPMVLDSAANLVKAERVRVCWFRLIGDERPRLEPSQYAGRADEPTTVFEKGTDAGDLMFDLIRRDGHLFTRDVPGDRLSAWREPALREFPGALIAVPVVAGGRAYGLLTVDSLTADSLTEAEVPFVRLLAYLLGDAIAASAPDRLEL